MTNVSLRSQVHEKWVVNLSEAVLTYAQEEVLSLVLNSVPAVPIRLPL